MSPGDALFHHHADPMLNASMPPRWLRVALGRYYFDAGVYAFPQAGLLEKGAASTMAYRINDWVRTPRHLNCSKHYCTCGELTQKVAVLNCRSY